MKKHFLPMVLVLSTSLMIGCSSISKVGLISNGNLEGKSFDNVEKGDYISGESCGHVHSLSTAFENSIKNTEYDTIVDGKVETTTALLVIGNCLKVSGYGVNSMKLVEGAK